MDDPINAIDPKGLDSDPLTTIKNGAKIMEWADILEKSTAIPEFYRATEDAMDSIGGKTKEWSHLGPPSEDNWEEYEAIPDNLNRLHKEKGGKVLEIGGEIAQP